ncbi:MAG: hypothetical protein B6U89_07515 [Desulfurococcales archaeon ex4484_58]|nr:MAG: hypothetical protein B6U89_07515 [Desulfurococcales archaeon ex4484_58]
MIHYSVLSTSIQGKPYRDGRGLIYLLIISIVFSSIIYLLESNNDYVYQVLAVPVFIVIGDHIFRFLLSMIICTSIYTLIVSVAYLLILSRLVSYIMGYWRQVLIYIVASLAGLFIHSFFMISFDRLESHIIATSVPFGVSGLLGVMLMSNPDRIRVSLWFIRDKKFDKQLLVLIWFTLQSMIQLFDRGTSIWGCLAGFTIGSLLGYLYLEKISISRIASYIGSNLIVKRVRYPVLIGFILVLFILLSSMPVVFMLSNKYYALYMIITGWKGGRSFIQTHSEVVHVILDNVSDKSYQELILERYDDVKSGFEYLCIRKVIGVKHMVLLPYTYTFVDT